MNRIEVERVVSTKAQRVAPSEAERVVPSAVERVVRTRFGANRVLPPKRRGTMRSPFLRAAVLVALAACLPRAHAQGGPPMITDDPGSPGPNHWEINLGWESERAAGATTTSLPLLDANYGVGDRIELTYEAPWAILQAPDESARSGYGSSLFGLKYRYLDNGDQGWQASIYPQWTEHGLGTPADTLLLPFEFAKDFGGFALDFDLGSVLSDQRAARGWMGGFLIGKDLRKGWEIDAEVHLNSDLHLGRTEEILNVGTRIDFSEHLTLMLALGTDLANTLAPRTSYLSYLGFQLRL